MRSKLLSSRHAPYFGLLGLACALPVLAGACSSEVPAPSTRGPILVESVREELESADCELFVRCGSMPDQATCLDMLSADQQILQLLADVVFGTVTYDPAAARTCVDAIRAGGCETLASTQKTLNDACAPVFKGKLAEGDGCVVDRECAGKSFCDDTECMGSGACCIGKCAPEIARVPLGGDCSMEACVEEAYCKQASEEGDTPTCDPRKDNGQPCKASDACLDGQRCDIGGGDICYKLSSEGQPCNPKLANGSCLRADNWCDTTEKKCVKLPGVGEPCATGMKCLGYAYCDEPTMTCKARPMEGEACVPNGPSCLGGLGCKSIEMKDICTRSGPASVCVL